MSKARTKRATTKRKAPRQRTPPTIVARLRAHMRADPRGLAIAVHTFDAVDRPNIQHAVDAQVAALGGTATWVGVADPMNRGLADLASPSGREVKAGDTPSEAAVVRVSVELGEDEVVSCAKDALCFVEAKGTRLAIFVSDQRWASRGSIDVGVMAPTEEAAAAVIAFLREWTRRENVYRGRVLALDAEGRISVLRLPAIERESIILPPALLERIELQTLQFSAHADEMRAARRHLKRGMLLYGPPGTGKTMITTYLARRQPGRTTFVVGDFGYGALARVCAFARMLQPAMVVLEDVDLIAEGRDHSLAGSSTVLFQLLNDMDGVAEDADILFVLTTNRPGILEPALAARPGRIDLAVEVPLPDAACRERLFALYETGLAIDVPTFRPWIERTDGASPAFIRELLRKAALLAADERAAVGNREALRVTARHLDAAMEMLVASRLMATVAGGGSLWRDPR